MNLSVDILQLLQPNGNGITLVSKPLHENGLANDSSTHDFVPLQHMMQYQHILWSQIQQQPTIQTSTNYSNSILLEIVGKSQQGKTEILMQCIAHAICPQLQKLSRPSTNWKDYIIESNFDNSNSNQIFYFDCQGKWNAFRFLQILESKLVQLLRTIYNLSNQVNEVETDMEEVLIWMSTTNTKSTEKEVQLQHGRQLFDQLLTNCLKRVKLFRPSHCMEFWITMEALNYQYIQSIQLKQQHSFTCQLFCVDGMNSLYEASQFDKTQQVEWKQLCASILKFCKLVPQCIAMVTKVPISKTNTEADFMPKEWIDSVTHRLFLSKPKPRGSTHNVKQAVLKFQIPNSWIVSPNSSWYATKQQIQESFTKTFKYRILEHGIEWC